MSAEAVSWRVKVWRREEDRKNCYVERLVSDRLAAMLNIKLIYNKNLLPKQNYCELASECLLTT